MNLKTTFTKNSVVPKLAEIWKGKIILDKKKKKGDWKWILTFGLRMFGLLRGVEY